MQNLDEAIRECAYHLWTADGRQDGKADAYWIAAQREILAKSLAEGTAFERTARIELEVEAEVKYSAKKAKAASSAARKSKRRAA